MDTRAKSVSEYDAGFIYYESFVPRRPEETFPPSEVRLLERKNKCRSSVNVFFFKG